ncbi:hypothetical protein EV141_1431 [Microcella putealis]|uniref:Mce-associated membrane protein n=1 Tax=Microcella putealis TaxID=337005 RepID=A0A4Q7LTP6_9MICO|nr:hypothetical protein [Microcella putealis]RZS57713.1 hypothetical protein EV141_1431 [Microcella putealis]TQM24780.1 hypothetical protein BJ957_1040 [Microcella putealis]
MPRRSLTAVTGLLLLGLTTTLVGCSDTTRLPDPTPEASADPLFASDEEALAAAVEVYERYLTAADDALNDPALALDNLNAIASDALTENIVAIRANLEEQGLQIVGYRTIVNSIFQSSVTEHSSTEVSFYVCESVADTDILNDGGMSTLEDDRLVLSEWMPTVSFDGSSEGEVVARELWQGGGICDAE